MKTIKIATIIIFSICAYINLFAVETVEPIKSGLINLGVIQPTFDKILTGFQWSGRAKMNLALNCNSRASGYDFNDLGIIQSPTQPLFGILQIPGKNGAMWGVSNSPNLILLLTLVEKESVI